MEKNISPASSTNHLRRCRSRPPEGKIFDCNGKLLAYNESSYNLSFTSNADLTEAADKKNMSVNELRNEIVYKTILILEQNGDSLSVELPIKLDANGNMKFTISGSQLQYILYECLWCKLS